MALRPKFTEAELRKMFQAKQERIEAAILNRLKFIGEKFVKNARENNTYKDQTGNLRSSIGYIILRNGIQVVGNFKRMQNVNEGEKRSRRYGSNGIQAALELTNEIQAQYPLGFVLIVVAGMEYASVVESRNLDVLTASSQQAELELKKAISELANKIGRMR